MSTPQAKYEIVADDKTKAAFTSAINNINEFHHKFEGLMNFAVAGFTFDRIAEGIHQAVELGDQMAHAAEKSGIAVEQFSALSYAAKQLGDIDLPSLSNGIKKMQVNIAAGSEVFEKLGINFEELKNQQPEKQFETIAETISKIQDPAQKTAAAVKIFGKAGADLIPIFAEGADGIHRYVEEAQRLGVVITKDQAEALQQADEAVKRLDASWQAFWKNAAANSSKIAQALGIIDKVPKEKFQDLYNEYVALQQKLDQLKSPDLLTRMLNPQGNLDIATQQIEQRIDKIKQLMASLQGQANKGFKDQFTDGMDESAIDDIVKAEAKQNALLRKITEEKTKATMEQFKKLGQEFDEYINSLDAADKATRTSAEKRTAIEDEFFANIAVLVRANEITQEESQKRITEYWENSHKMLSESTKKTMNDMAEYADEASRGIQNSLEEFFYDPAKEGLNGLLKGFLDTFRRIIAEAEATAIRLAIFGKSDDSGHFSGGFLSGFINDLTGLADGGPASGNTPYIVGERGPELFVPGVSGTIVPNHALANAARTSTINIVNNIDARGATQDAIKLLPGAMKSASDDAVARMLDMRRRGKF